jgi:membrane-associated phospholipid phosphatase
MQEKINPLPFDRLLTVMTKPLSVIIYFSLVILSFFYLDKPLANYFLHLDLGTNLSIISLITKLGLGIFYLPTFFLLILFFRYIRVNPQWEARAQFLFLCVGLPAIICVFLKIILGRARPDMLFVGQLYGFYGFQMNSYFWSLPSGHTTTIMGTVLGLGILFPRYFYALIIAGLTIAFSRVLLFYHYLSDVLIAIYLTLLEIGCLLWLIRRKFWLAPAWEHTI